jgi:hypothetical protein
MSSWFCEMASVLTRYLSKKYPTKTAEMSKKTSMYLNLELSLVFYNFS